MKVRLCNICGYQLYSKSRKCPRCRTPVNKVTPRHYFISALILVFPVLIFLLPPFSQDDFFNILPSREPIQSEAVKKIKVPPPTQESGKNPTTVFVKAVAVELRQRPTLESPTLWKFGKGQQLTQIARSGDWIHVRVDDSGDKQGWVHVSLVGEIIPRQPLKPVTQHQAYNAFLKFFELINTETKLVKGTAFFDDVEYLDKGVIQLTATGVFLSAPESNKKNYVGKITKKWFALRDGFPAVVRIVDEEGILRMKKKRG